MNPWRWWRQAEPSSDRWDQLARYNTECSHGIVHTPEWDERMAIEQAEFNKEMERRRLEGESGR